MLIVLQILTIITHSKRLMHSQAIFMYLMQGKEIVEKFCFDVFNIVL
jgi:hypothetical protein